MMKKTLIPVDYSDTSLNALSYAINLFKGQALEITILHTYKLMSSSAYTMKIDSIKRVMKEDAEREMNSLLRRLEKEEPNVSFKSKILNRRATSTITSMGDGGDYDFIVMGTKGASGLKEVFIGSVAGWVISKTKVPVIVVPGDYHHRPLRKMVLAISDQPISNKSVMNPLIDIVTMASCNVNVLHIMKDHNPVAEELMKTIDHLNPTVNYVPDEGNINDGLNDFLKDHDADLLCMIRCKKGLFKHLFIESATLKQTFHTSVPLLILHDN
jgi:nucleotide-binding universal stress UspA family protein